MVSFRFYLVSVIAIFLALAVGITMGATVIDQVTVDQLHRNIRTADAQARAATQARDIATGQRDAQFNISHTAAAALVAQRLAGVHVVVIGVKGGDASQTTGVRDLLAAAGADIEGTVWFTG